MKIVFLNDIECVCIEDNVDIVRTASVNISTFLYPISMERINQQLNNKI